MFPSHTLDCYFSPQRFFKSDLKNCNNKKYNFLKPVHSQFKCNKVDLNELGILFINVEVTQKPTLGAVFLCAFLKWKGQFHFFFFL